ncbi:hypothetical protein OIE66_28525 [Nonomuraea sp. NBC_01738]|uniref:hypothetical protein n=1 Tax=Nonomuraea sp. NBC_01738 TaxID=2976003 RepID=UPI002E166659|nr:hypothetical protein OIE66_28525 [Nonomuraea sp. NBC_01738]
MRSVILGGLVAALVASTAAPALGASPLAASGSKPLTSAQLVDALLAPEDLGERYVRNPKRIREALETEYSHTRKCTKAIGALKPLLRGKALSVIDRNQTPSGLRQYALSGTPARLASWQGVGTAMVRDCAGMAYKTSKEKASVKKLSVGKLGSWTYAIRYRSTATGLGGRELIATDLVLTRVGNVVTLLVTDGFFGAFEPTLSRRAGKLAAAKLREAQD